MALTWATRVRFGRATRRNDRENELHLAPNAHGGLGHRLSQKTLISKSYFMFLAHFRISVSIYVLLKLMKSSELNFEKTEFSLQILWPLGCNLGVGEELHGYS
ncbi:hypothetical protein Hanom_Chr05g00471401 [Helianthus anomalus]